MKNNSVKTPNQSRPASRSVGASEAADAKAYCDDCKPGRRWVTGSRFRDTVHTCSKHAAYDALVAALEGIAPRCDEYVGNDDDYKTCGAIAVAEGSFGMKFCYEHRGERELVTAGVKVAAALSLARGEQKKEGVNDE